MSSSPIISRPASARALLRVLLLEDNCLDADTTIMTLERAGYSPSYDRVQTRNEFLERLSGDYDIILADYNLPSFDGISALKLFLEKELDIPFILISGALGEETAIESLKTGATDYVLKRDIRRLGPAVRRALRECEEKRQRKRAEAAMRESDERYRQLFERSLAIKLLINPESGEIDYANPAACKFYGYDLDHIRAINIRDIDAHSEQNQLSGQSLSSNKPWSSLCHHKLASGEARFVEVQSSAINLGGKNLIYSIVNDITERMLTQEALLKSESRLRSLVESNLVGILFSTLDGEIFDANEAFLSLVGHTEEEVRERRLSWSNLTPRKFHFRDRRAMDELKSTGACTAYEKELNRRDGESIPVLVGCAMLEGSEDTFISFILDLTERKKAEFALRKSEEKYRDLYENASDVIYTHDLDGNFTSINSRVEAVTGYRVSELVGGNISNVLAPENRGLLLDSFKTHANNGHAIEAELISKAGSRISVEINSRVIFEDGRPVAIQGIARDVSERKHAEAQRRQLEEELIQAQKLESIGRLAGGVAHDFNNLLTAILGNAQLVIAETAPDHPDYGKLVQIEKAAVRAASLTRQLLIFGRRQKLERRTVNINETINDFIKLLQRIIGEDVDVCVSASPEIGPIFADPRQIEQVIMNLGVNARDAMPGGGRLTIATAQIDLDYEAVCDRPLAHAGSYARFTVTDTGVGMDEETLQHIFEPFFTTKGVEKGTGLGLAVVYGIVNQHEGFIEVESSPGLGTTFSVYLPINDTVGEESSHEVSSPLRGGVETVLIAEDEEILRRLIKEVLSGLGYNVLLAADGEEALRLFSTSPQAISLVLLDFVMPRMGGRDVYERLRGLGNKAPVIFMTGHSTEVIQGEFLETIGARLIRKPYSVGELGRIVREVLDHQGARIS